MGAPSHRLLLFSLLQLLFREDGPERRQQLPQVEAPNASLSADAVSAVVGQVGDETCRTAASGLVKEARTQIVQLHEAVVDGDGEKAEFVCVADA